MASFVFNGIKKQIGNGTFSFNVNDGQLRLALFSSGIFDNNNLTYSSKTRWDEIKHLEITEVSGYNSEQYGPKSLTGVGIGDLADAGGVCDDGLLDQKVYANDVVYPVSTIDADCALIVRTASTSGQIQDDDLPVMAIDIRNNGNTISSNQGVFTIRLNSNSGGFLIIK